MFSKGRREGKRKQVKREERIREERKGREKERESGKGVDGDDDVEFGMIESERSEDLDSVVEEICDDDVVVSRTVVLLPPPLPALPLRALHVLLP